MFQLGAKPYTLTLIFNKNLNSVKGTAVYFLSNPIHNGYPFTPLYDQ